MNTSFCPPLLAGSGAGIASASVNATSLTNSPFNSPLRSVQPRWARINHRLQQQQGTPTKTFSTTSLTSPSNDALSGEVKKVASSSASCCDRFIPNRSVNDTEGSEYVLLINQQQHQQQKEQPSGSNAESSAANEEDSLRVLSFSLKEAQEVCGLEWSDNANNSASSLLCSGGNDNLNASSSLHSCLMLGRAKLIPIRRIHTFKTRRSVMRFPPLFHA